MVHKVCEHCRKKYIYHNNLNLPAPHSPEGRLPVCIQSRFIRDTSLSAVIETSWVFSPNSNL